MYQYFIKIPQNSHYKNQNSFFYAHINKFLKTKKSHVFSAELLTNESFFVIILPEFTSKVVI